MTDAQLALIISAASATVALLSVGWTISWSIWQYRRLHRPRLTVLATNALPFGLSRTGNWCVSVTAVNDGGIAVTVTSLKFMVRDDSHRRGIFPRQWIHADPKSLPITLAPGERWNGLAELTPLAATLRETFGRRPEFKLWVVVDDAADRSYRGKFVISGDFGERLTQPSTAQPSLAR